MVKSELLKCVEFFNDLEIIERDVTNEKEKEDGIKVVEADYSYKGKTYTTAKLFYKNILHKSILHQKSVNEPSAITQYFEDNVFWLDPEKHIWVKKDNDKFVFELKDKIIDTMIPIELATEQNNNFKELFLKIANDNNDGFLQKLFDDKYSRLFPNINHWHDIIFLVQEMIKHKGKEVSRKYFLPLVFEYYRGRGNTYGHRTSLAKTKSTDSRVCIDNLYKSLNEHFKEVQQQGNQMVTTAETEELKILKQKKQIILQGPPGTGKTYTAKDLAEQIIFNKITANKKEQKKLLESTEQFKLIQFHPAYSYEDFVRGVVAKSKENFIEYVTENKILAQFASDAYKNWAASNETTNKFAKEAWVKKTLDNFKNFLSDEIDNKDNIKITDRVYIHCIDDKSIRFKSNSNAPDGGVPNSDIVNMYLSEDTNIQQVIENKTLSKTSKHRPNIWFGILQLFKKYIDDMKLKFEENSSEIKEKPYVLIIDEINRANLPAVLGELIYALEYRGEKVESMYATDEGNTIVIPPNLLIIGTMNTSDRSVGHIDYAIRRRFAFIDVLPKILDDDKFEIELFKTISSLFIKNFDDYVNNTDIALEKSEHLSEEFRPEDVWLGHSYFIKNEIDFELRIKYEIKPILKEYVKDGILKQSAEAIINGL